ncbi:GDSL-type esterase/lipase family protein [Salinicoccus halodurans]|uniref:Lysophospholipase L1 n=1 Tax=Salinicoccus halodurans TaxID=407035 RepID=A0A0F7HNE1_9STAP|nr:GDSL-type esterase/lipase family protein [Salinicoccus halodurans]AKG74629.1 hypothetical protein AAT16_10755 [Salinicoccus halodurans]SFK89051.1 Lysophospholipase L1 [Salinicoccus halodurans]
MNRTMKWIFIIVTVTAVISAAIYFSIVNFGSENVPQADEVEEDNIKVAAVGDSTTYGLMINNREENAYPFKLGELLGEDHWVENFGANNYAAMKSADFPYRMTDEYENSLDFNADIAVIMLGTNDSKNTNYKNSGQFREEYIALVDTYAENNPEMEIYLATPPKAFNDADMPGNINNENIDEITEVIKGISSEKDFGLIDINQLTQEKRDWFQLDGIHPNAEGAENIAEEVHQHISE